VAIICFIDNRPFGAAKQTFDEKILSAYRLMYLGAIPGGW
jgi:hypothetical protein